MPTYQYICKKCKHEFEEFQKMSDDAFTKCPSCKTKNLKRMIGSGGPLVFKGSGYYLTDYKKANVGANDTSPTKEKSPSKESTETKSETKTEAKVEIKSEVKSEAKKTSTKTSSEKTK